MHRGENGVKANAAQIVAWWCVEDGYWLARACEESAPPPVLLQGRDDRSLPDGRKEELRWATSGSRSVR